jgi:hypothetical protein
MGEYVENYGDGKMLHTGDRIHTTLRLSPLRSGDVP